MQELLRAVFREFKSIAPAIALIIIHNRIVKSSGCPDNRNRAVLEAVDLVQPAGLIARRHQEKVTARFNFMGNGVVIGDFYSCPLWILFTDRCKQIVILLLAGSQKHKSEVYGHKLINNFRQQVKALLICKT